MAISALQEEGERAAEGSAVEVAQWELGGFLSQGGQLFAVQQLVIKGLWKPETELASIEVHAFSKTQGQPCLYAVCPGIAVQQVVLDDCACLVE